MFLHSLSLDLLPLLNDLFIDGCYNHQCYLLLIDSGSGSGGDYSHQMDDMSGVVANKFRVMKEREREICRCMCMFESTLLVAFTATFSFSFLLFTAV